MIHLVMALYCEAKPLIAALKLKMISSSPFPIYAADKQVLTLSDVGKVQAAAATANLFHYSRREKDQIWLNIGIAGHPHCEIGTPIVAHKIHDLGTKRNYYPFVTKGCHLASGEIHTLEEPNKNYKKEVFYEMEAAGFYPIASRFSTVERIHCLKIVSDNALHSTENICASYVCDLLESQIESIMHLLSLLSSLARTEIPYPLHPFLEKWHFSQTEKNHLIDLLIRWKACQPHSDIWDEALSVQKNSQDVLETIENKINSTFLCFTPST